MAAHAAAMMAPPSPAPTSGPSGSGSSKQAGAGSAAGALAAPFQPATATSSARRLMQAGRPEGCAAPLPGPAGSVLEAGAGSCPQQLDGGQGAEVRGLAARECWPGTESGLLHLPGAQCG
jgi:hypothetical protein